MRAPYLGDAGDETDMLIGKHPMPASGRTVPVEDINADYRDTTTADVDAVKRIAEGLYMGLYPIPALHPEGPSPASPGAGSTE